LHIDETKFVEFCCPLFGTVGLMAKIRSPSSPILTLGFTGTEHGKEAVCTTTGTFGDFSTEICDVGIP
jgi:ApbE superfamily uncharacterized protein (UPF0280 family)